MKYIPPKKLKVLTIMFFAAAGFGIPLTHRDDATSALFITGHQCKSAEKQDWNILAKLNPPHPAPKITTFFFAPKCIYLKSLLIIIPKLLRNKLQ